MGCWAIAADGLLGRSHLHVELRFGIDVRQIATGFGVPQGHFPTLSGHDDAPGAIDRDALALATLEAVEESGLRRRRFLYEDAFGLDELYVFFDLADQWYAGDGRGLLLGKELARRHDGALVDDDVLGPVPMAGDAAYLLHRVGDGAAHANGVYQRAFVVVERAARGAEAAQGREARVDDGGVTSVGGAHADDSAEDVPVIDAVERAATQCALRIGAREGVGNNAGSDIVLHRRARAAAETHVG